MTAEADYDCQQCGACCLDRQAGSGYVSLSRHEGRQMRSLGLHVIEDTACVLLGTRAREGVCGRVCVAFTGAIGGPCGCSVYTMRPRVCRTYQVGSNECRKERIAAGLPV